MKTVKYRGFIYWILMILGIFVGNLFDKVDKELLFCMLFAIIFEIFGDAISQITMWTTLENAKRLFDIKCKRNFFIFYMAMWTGFFPFPAFIEGLYKGFPVISIIEIPLFILLLTNQLRWINYRIKKWKIDHRIESKPNNQ